MKCTKCQRSLHDCQTCNGGRKRGIGGGALTCSNCRSTGLVCPSHGGNWK